MKIWRLKMHCKFVYRCREHLTVEYTLGQTELMVRESGWKLFYKVATMQCFTFHSYLLTLRHACVTNELKILLTTNKYRYVEYIFHHSKTFTGKNSIIVELLPVPWSSRPLAWTRGPSPRRTDRRTCAWGTWWPGSSRPGGSPGHTHWQRTVMSNFSVN